MAAARPEQRRGVHWTVGLGSTLAALLGLVAAVASWLLPPNGAVEWTLVLIALGITSTATLATTIYSGRLEKRQPSATVSQLMAYAVRQWDQREMRSAD